MATTHSAFVFPTLASSIGPVTPGKLIRAISKKVLSRGPVRANMSVNVSASGMKLPEIKQNSVLPPTTTTDISDQTTTAGLTFTKKFYSPVVRSKSKFINKPTIRVVEDYNRQSSSVLKSSVSSPSKIVTKSSVFLPKEIRESLNKQENGNIDTTLLSPKWANKKVQSEENSTPTTPTTSTNSQKDNTRIIIKKRGEKKVVSPRKRLIKGGTASTIAEPGLPDYFSRHVRTCAKTHHDYIYDEFTVDDRTRDLHKYMEDNHRNMKIMRDDFLVEKPKVVNLVRKFPQKKLLMLDLDETLIHCTGDLSKQGLFDMEVDFINQDGIPLKGLLNIRPGAKQFLQKMSAHYEVAIYTASLKYYADRILKIIDPSKQYISHILYRESCARTKSGKLVKDLSVVGNVPLESIILVDNNMYSMWPQPHHGIPILHFTYDRTDRELDLLQEYLTALVEGPHTETLKETFRVSEMLYADSLADYYSCFDPCF